MRPPAPPSEADWIVMESTYGDRDHADADPLALVAEVLTRTCERGGTLLIPSFAVGRAQTLLYCLHEIFRRGMAPEVPVFVNSPMATDVTALYERHVDFHRLTREQCAAVCDVATYTRSVDESRELAALRGRMVILSASGMATGGRVLHHLKALAPDHHNTILLVGFQAPGTRGHALVEGARSIKIHGEYVPVRAEVVSLEVFSAHADQGQLLAWLGACRRPPRGVVLVHGEPVGADVLRRRIRETQHLEAGVAEYRETLEL
jgi:metallo-beta-lactamase family protein